MDHASYLASIWHANMTVVSITSSNFKSAVTLFILHIPQLPLRNVDATVGGHIV